MAVSQIIRQKTANNDYNDNNDDDNLDDDEMEGLHNWASNGKQGKAHNVTLQVLLH